MCGRGPVALQPNLVKITSMSSQLNYVGKQNGLPMRAGYGKDKPASFMAQPAVNVCLLTTENPYIYIHVEEGRGIPLTKIHLPNYHVRCGIKITRKSFMRTQALKQASS